MKLSLFSGTNFQVGLMMKQRNLQNLTFQKKHWAKPVQMMPITLPLLLLTVLIVWLAGTLNI